MSFCDVCYESAPKCPRASDANADCCARIADISSLRIGSTAYDSRINKLSDGLRGVSGQHMNALLGQMDGEATPEALTAEEQAVYNTRNDGTNYQGLLVTNLTIGVDIVAKRFGEYAKVKTRMSRLFDEATSQASIMKIEAMLRRLDELKKEMSDKSGHTGSASTYKETMSPLYQLWHKMVKHAVDGLDSAEETDSKSFYDANTGKTYVPFQKMPKCQRPGHLFRAWSKFREVVTSLYDLAPKAWDGLEKRIYRTEETMGFLIAQQFVGEVLRKLDLKEFESVGALLAHGEHNRVLDDLRPPLVPVNQDLNPKPDAGKGRIKTGPVTKQGEFASLIKDRNGKALICMQHKNGHPCKIGVAAGQGHDEHVGKCAYHHQA